MCDHIDAIKLVERGDRSSLNAASRKAIPSGSGTPAEALPRCRWRTGGPARRPPQPPRCELEAAVAGALRKYDCFVDQPLIDLAALQALIQEIGVASGGSSSAQIHVAALVTILWLEAAVQETTTLRTADDLLVFASGLKMTLPDPEEARQLNAVFGAFCTLWLAKRTKSASVDRPAGIAAALVGATRDVNSATRSDAKQLRELLRINDGQSKLRNRLCRFLTAFLGHAKASSYVPVAASLVTPRRAVLRSVSPLLFAQWVPNAARIASDIITTAARTARDANGGTRLHEDELRLLRACAQVVAPAIMVKAAGFAPDGWQVAADGSLWGHKLDDREADRGVSVFARLSDFEQPDLPLGAVDLLRLLQTFANSTPFEALTSQAMPRFCPIPESTPCARRLTSIAQAGACPSESCGVLVGSSSPPVFACRLACGRVVTLGWETVFEHHVVSGLSWARRGRRRVFHDAQEVLEGARILKTARSEAQVQQCESVAILESEWRNSLKADGGCSITRLVAGWARRKGSSLKKTFDFDVHRSCLSEHYVAK